MAWLDYFRKGQTQRSAALAKDRLSIIVAREGRSRGKLQYLPQLKLELLQVLAKYEKIDLEQVTVNVENNGDCEVLELNIVLTGAPEPLKEPFVAPDQSFFSEPTSRVRAAMR
jgi:cell division topological specificity factor